MGRASVWAVLLAALLCLAPQARAAVEVVDVDGTVYTVAVVPSGGLPSSDQTALSYTVLQPTGSPESGVIAPTEDTETDREPQILLSQGGPILIWTRNDGVSDQIAYSRYSSGSWGGFRYMTWGTRNNGHPIAGIDAEGRGYLLWVEELGRGRVMLASFNPQTGHLYGPAKILVQELNRFSAPEWLSQSVVKPSRPTGGKPSDDILPEGGNDVPIIPPGVSSGKDSNRPDGALLASPSCSKVVAAVKKNRALWIGVIHDGSVIKYYRSNVPPGASSSYLDLLLQALQNRHCN